MWLPAGRHELRYGGDEPALRVLHANLDLLTVHHEANGLDFDYASESRGLLLLDRGPGPIRIDGTPAEPKILEAPRHWTVVLPSGRQGVRIEASAPLVLRVE